MYRYKVERDQQQNTNLTFCCGMYLSIKMIILYLLSAVKLHIFIFIILKLVKNMFIKNYFFNSMFIKIMIIILYGQH